MTLTFNTSPSQVSPIAYKAPDNLIFFSRQVLEKCLPRETERVKAELLAELFVRYYMSGDHKLAEIIDRYLPNGERLIFNGILPYAHRGNLKCDVLNQDLWTPKNDFSRRCQNSVRRRLQQLFKAEGLIPVFMNRDAEQAFLLPFSFEDGGDIMGVFDLDGHKIDEWSDHLKTLDINCLVRLHCHCLDDQPFEGASMMLPVQMAWWRRQENDEHLLPYHPFSIVATGAFDRNGLLEAVELKSKPYAVMTQLWKASFIYPQNNESIPDKLQVTPLSPAISKAAVKQEIRDFVEQRTNWDKDYALHRLRDLSQEVRQWNVSHWQELIASLERASIAYNQYENPENYLLNLMLQSEANCHCGNTVKAKEINQRALAFAEEHDQMIGGSSFLYFILRLQIEQLVLHQDDEEFEMILAFSGDLEVKLKEFEVTSADKALTNDLWMRYSGTMGQIHLCATLIGLEGFSSPKAEAYFRQAIRHAIATKDDADMAQDFNYMVYYHAMYEPGSEQEKDAIQAAESKLAELERKGNKAYRRNRFFFLRYVALSLYRQVLLGTIPAIPDTFEFEQLFRKGKDGAEGWLQATVGKYLGTVFAANGDLKSAEEWFAKAVSAIDESAQGIILFIKMTVCAEAYRSLNKELYLNEARAILKKVMVAMPKYKSLPIWKQYLENPLNGFPGLKYWY